MPAAAQALGAVEHELPLAAIAGAIVTRLRQHGPVRGGTADPARSAVRG
jgi:chemotaxis response regulator CheB